MQVGLIFVFGAILGSFLNVCIYRLPETLSQMPSRNSDLEQHPDCQLSVVVGKMQAL
jgi:prepilin signal peptidase PulO-like enzyme (type II secretory pathway)